MTKVICLVGASGSGKTTIAKELEDKYNIIQSYTTRQPRSENEWGHIFLDKTKWYPVSIDNTFVGIENNGDPDLTDKGISHLYDKEDYIYIDIDDMIAYKEIYGEHYFVTDLQVIRGKTNIYVVDPDGANQVKEYYKNKREPIQVKTIALAADRKVREDRMINRALPTTVSQWRGGKTYCFQEILRETKDRVSKDKDIFSVIDCDCVIDGNRKVEEVKNDLVAAIERL